MIPKFYNATLELGKLYLFSYSGFIRETVCEFIQVSQKGYNFLDIHRSRCVLKRHLYLTKKQPTEPEKVRVRIPETIHILPYTEEE